MSESQGEGAPTERPTPPAGAPQAWALPDGDGGQSPSSEPAPAPSYPAPSYPGPTYPAPGQPPQAYPPQGQPYAPQAYGVPPGQPYAAQPYGVPPGQPYPAQPYAPQPYAPQPYAPQPYAPQPPAYGPQPYGRPAYPPPAYPPTGYPAGAYGYPPAGYQPTQAPAAKPAWDWCSIVGFVVSFLAAGLGAGLALSIAGIVRTQRGARRGRGLAIAGVVVCLVWLVTWAAWPQDEEDSPGGGVDAGRPTAAAPITPSAGGSTSAKPTTPTAKPSPPSAKPSPAKPSPAKPSPAQPSPAKPHRDHLVGINDLQPGDCVDLDDDEDETTALPVVSCAGDHTAEVISQVDLPKAAYPGQKSLDARSWVVCQVHFEKALEVSRLDSYDYDLYTYYPDQDAWRHGDRRITCLLVDYDGDDLHGQQLHLNGRAI